MRVGKLATPRVRATEPRSGSAGCPDWAERRSDIDGPDGAALSTTTTAEMGANGGMGSTPIPLARRKRLERPPGRARVRRRPKRAARYTAAASAPTRARPMSLAPVEMLNPKRAARYTAG